MSLTLRYALASLSVCLLVGSHVAAQTPAAAPQQQAVLQQQQAALQAQQPGIATQQQPGVVPQQQPGVAPVQPAAPQAPAGFQLNALQQAFLDQLLDAWETQSGKVNTFRCSFERWEYNPTFGPGPNIPLNKDKGELSFQKPDKGSFQITEIRRWQAEPVPAGQQPPQPAKGDWIPQKDAIGEHWVCDGKAVYEYRQVSKQLVERPIPPEMQGKAIVDGPLPFLFGAEAAKLKARYWLKVEEQPNQNQLWLIALPRFQVQAADFRGVRLILDRTTMMPTHMEVHLPDGSRHLYMFDVANATVNGRFEMIQQFFQRPRTPLGWQRVVEQAPALQQAAQPAQQPR